MKNSVKKVSAVAPTPFDFTKDAGFNRAVNLIGHAKRYDRFIAGVLTCAFDVAKRASRRAGHDFEAPRASFKLLELLNQKVCDGRSILVAVALAATVATTEKQKLWIIKNSPSMAAVAVGCGVWNVRAAVRSAVNNLELGVNIPLAIVGDAIALLRWWDQNGNPISGNGEPQLDLPVA